MSTPPPLTAAIEASRAYPLVDRRCSLCNSKGVYRMVGRCANCGNSPLLVLLTAGHEAVYDAECPKCGCYKVRCERLAEDDELSAVTS